MKKTTKQKNKELANQGLVLRHYGINLRMVPNKKQEEIVHSTNGSARFVFNLYLNEKIQQYKYDKTNLKYKDFKKFFNQFKQRESVVWLKEPDKFACECAMEQVDDAFERFYKGQNKFPKFKSKHRSKQSYSTKETNNNIELDIENETIKLPKLKKVKVRLSKQQKKNFKENGFKGKIKGATISYHSSGQYYVSLKIEEVVSLQPSVSLESVPTEQIIGIDLGLTHFYIDSKGKKVNNPRYLQNSLKKLATLQRQLKNKKMHSSNYKKLQNKISRLHLHISNQRKDFLHKESRNLVNENQVIVLEDLNVTGLIKNKKLARSIGDVGWATFKTFLMYKANWANKQVLFVDRFYASSKTCGHCEEKNPLLSLSDRIWVCPNCGEKHDRDINAANNIKNEGIRLATIAV